ncbi:MAG: type II toxin-antitoxin system RelE/ParE family toxin [Sulfuricaulis sp.]
MKSIKFHPKALTFIRDQSAAIRQAIGESLRDVQKGISLGLPLSRPMSERVFYFIKLTDAIVVFHGFRKMTQKTPRHEMKVGSKRLQEVLDGKI